jgi:hypothetical protein
MDWAQLLNGIAALIAMGAAHVAFVKLGTNSPAVITAHFAQLLLLTWYATLNLSLAFNLWDAELAQLVPLFRYAFAPLLITYAARQILAARRTVTL